MSAIADSDVAIIGMACRVAGADSPSQLWDVIGSSVDVQSDITRFNTSGYYHPDGGSRKGLTNVRKAYMLEDEAIDKFDNAFFYTTPLEAAAMDPQQRMLLEIAYETIESAGIPLEKFRGTDTAVFAGMEGSEYGLIAGRDVDATPRYLATGTPTCMAANRLSYFFDLSGPSMVVDTACSSTMAALHQAVRTLQHGDAKMALVCGAKLILSPDMFIPSSELGFLSPDGRCKSFDASADGYGRGEGILALLLKPLKLAIADRDPVRAVIKGTRLNQDGRTQGITLPSADAQRRNMMDLYAELGFSPRDIQYLEAHGTGTAAGDPLEFSAINTVFEPSRKDVDPLIVGSVKSNIGHLESSSALASFMKVIQCLEKGSIPAQLHFRNPNPDIDFQSVTIPTKILSWPATRDGGRRAAINTFGAGGTNGHAVLEASTVAPRIKALLQDRPCLFKVSAADDASLSALSSAYAAYAERVSPGLQDLAHTLLSRRSTLRKSKFFTASSVEEVLLGFRGGDRSAVPPNGGCNPRVILLFTGQGAQWPQMGSGLIKYSPLFKKVLTECDQHLSKLHDPPSWSLIEEFAKVENITNVYNARFSQPMCTALQIGIITLLDSWGLKADAVVGHSSGEIAAAYAAGKLSMRDAITIAYYRGLVLGDAENASQGSMCAVGLSEEDAGLLAARYEGKVQIAAVNSATSCTLSGDSGSIKEIVARVNKRRQFCRGLRVDQAYHSHHMLPLAPLYLQKLEAARIEVRHGNPTCKMFSSVTGQYLNPEDLASSYWVKNMTSTVRFSAALEQCVKGHSEAAVIVEIGPHPALRGPAQEILRSLGRCAFEYIGTCSRGEDDFRSLLSSAGRMIAAGLILKTENINAREVVDGLQCSYEYASVLTDLPSYQWNHSAGFWSESRLSRNMRFRKFPRHQLLGSRYVDDIPNRPCWRNQLCMKEVPWIQELKARGALEIPPAAYVLMGLEASRQLSVSSSTNEPLLVLSDVQFDSAFALSAFVEADTSIETQLVAKQLDDAAYNFEFEIFSAPSANEHCWIRHCSGKLGWTNAPSQSSVACTRPVEHDQALLDIVKSLKPHLIQGLEDVKMDHKTCHGMFAGAPDKHENYSIDPLALDSILGLPSFSLLGDNLPSISRLSSIASVKVPMLQHESIDGSFITGIKSSGPCASICDIGIIQDKNSTFLQGLKYQSTELLTLKPIAKSLFFKPVLLPDITKLSNSPAMELFYFIKLIIHKWPMSDIIINDLARDEVQFILHTLNLVDCEKRSYCRSVQCVGQHPGLAPKHVTYVDNFNETNMSHVIFSQHLQLTTELSSRLHSRGLLCSPRSFDFTDQDPAFEYVTTVTGMGLEPWLLWRKVPSIQPIEGDRACVLFSAMPAVPSCAISLKQEVVRLDAASVADFCQREKNGRFDAIVLDTADQSVITTWPGKTFIPWMQTLLELADSILWVTKDTRNPFANVAGTLLRTLQSEKPALKVRWLVIDAIKDGCVEASSKQVVHAYRDMLEGENELLVQCRPHSQEIIRYYPDDELSAKTGLIPPKRTKSTLEGLDYAVGFAVPGEPVVLSRHPSQDVLDPKTVHVEASIIDAEDIIRNGHDGQDAVIKFNSGIFFSGRVLTKEDGATAHGMKVVGWHSHHLHQSRVDSEPQRLLSMEKDCTFEEAACTFATLSVACCIIDGEARARPGEIMKAEVDDPLQYAISQVCQHLEVFMVDTSAVEEADVVVTSNDLDGVFVNGNKINLKLYLESHRGWETVRRIWEDRRCKIKPSSVAKLTNLKEAFKTSQQPWSTVLTHRVPDEPIEHVPIYSKPARVFSENCYYVIIGGLGGLGRFICSWMVANGAKHIATISRSGLNQSEAKATINEIETSGASIRVFQADACNRTTVSHILSTLRGECPIKGVINLAMILGDAPMDSMRGEEWDRAMRVKIDSSWILHEETLEDELDCFILFSSIASVLGNRNQGSYNVANTFLNALAEYRQGIDLPGISIALGAMTDIGILHSLSKPSMPQILSRSGLTHLTTHHLSKILEAAILTSPRRDHSLILTGLETFEREIDGSLVGRAEPIFWANLPEFGHLSIWRPPHAKKYGNVDGEEMGLKEEVERSKAGGVEALKGVVGKAFTAFLAKSLGFAVEAFDVREPLAIYGLDSLSGVGCQYWLHNELGVDISAGKILGGASIGEIVDMACRQLQGKA